MKIDQSLTCKLIDRSCLKPALHARIGDISQLKSRRMDPQTSDFHGPIDQELVASWGGPCPYLLDLAEQGVGG